MYVHLRTEDITIAQATNLWPNDAREQMWLNFLIFVLQLRENIQKPQSGN